MSIFAEKYNVYREILVKDALLVVQGVVSEDSFTGGLKMLAESVQSIYEARCSKLKRLVLSIDSNSEDGTANASPWVDSLQRSVNSYKDGNCPLEVDYIGASASGRMKLGNQWRVQPRDELIGQLREQFGKNSVTLHYD